MSSSYKIRGTSSRKQNADIELKPGKKGVMIKKIIIAKKAQQQMEKLKQEQSINSPINIAGMKSPQFKSLFSELSANAQAMQSQDHMSSSSSQNKVNCELHKRSMDNSLSSDAGSPSAQQMERSLSAQGQRDQSSPKDQLQQAPSLPQKDAVVLLGPANVSTPKSVRALTLKLSQSNLSPSSYQDSVKMDSFHQYPLGRDLPVAQSGTEKPLSLEVVDCKKYADPRVSLESAKSKQPKKSFFQDFSSVIDSSNPDSSPQNNKDMTQFLPIRESSESQEFQRFDSVKFIDESEFHQALYFHSMWKRRHTQNLQVRALANQTLAKSRLYLFRRSKRSYLRMQYGPFDLFHQEEEEDLRSPTIDFRYKQMLAREHMIEEQYEIQISDQKKSQLYFEQEPQRLPSLTHIQSFQANDAPPQKKPDDDLLHEKEPLSEAQDILPGSGPGS